MHRAPIRTALVLTALRATVAAAEPVPVTVVDASTATTCAEHDNVYVQLHGPGVTSFRIEATQPPYLDAIRVDHRTPDWRDCPLPEGHGPVTPPPPVRWQTVYEDDEWLLDGKGSDTFWRPLDVPVRVGEVTYEALEYVRLWRKRPDGTRDNEVLVLYPADGYWRAKPLPTEGLGDSVYGSSLLLGPIEEDGRPLVDLTEVVFDPAGPAFVTRFAKGGEARVVVEHVDRERLTLAVEFSEPVAGSGPFAALRSMYVTPERADAAVVAWRDDTRDDAGSVAIVGFAPIAADDVRLGRDVPAVHNTSAPDTRFFDFRADPERTRP